MSDNPILNGLNDAQIKAVRHTQGPLLVIAGAGSGKTKVLTHRIAYILDQGITKPENILAVTFTNKAAGEMKERVATLLGRKHDLPFVSTFHAFCVSFLRQEIDKLGFPTSFNICDTGDTKAIMKAIWKEHNFDDKRLVIAAVRNVISNAKNNLYSPIDYAKKTRNDFEQDCAEIYKIYQDRLKKEGGLDFDDLLFYTVQILIKFPEVLEKYQDKYQFIMIDEYQDTNYAQYKIISMLAEKYRNLAVIGDDWQSIYSWRGADMRNILEFNKEYPDALTVNLEQNYRSKGHILKAANQIIKMNKSRLDKNLWTENDDGEKIIYEKVYNEREEAQSIAEKIQNMKGDLQYKDFAILYRTNAQSRIIEEAMLRHAIPYKIVAGLKFYERKEIKDMIAYLRICQNPKDFTSLVRIINLPARKIGPKKIEELQDMAGKYESTPGELLIKQDIDIIQDGPLKLFSDFYKDIASQSYELNVHSLIKYILRASGYKEMLENSGEEGIERLENIYELVGVAEKYAGLEDPRMSLQIFLEEVSLISDQDNLEESENSVKLMTVHASKGLEFPVVFLPGLEEGLFPHARGLISSEDLEEERRLFYVALTRAEERIFIISTEQRFIYGEYEAKQASRFISEIPEENIEKPAQTESSNERASLIGAIMKRKEKLKEINEIDFSIGDQINHASWGEGKIISKTGSILEIDFKDKEIGLKKLVSHIAPISLLS